MEQPHEENNQISLLRRAHKQALIKIVEIKHEKDVLEDILEEEHLAHAEQDREIVLDKI